jgi:hypothetical protein
MSDQLVAETSTWQYTTLTMDRHPYPRWDSNPQSQQCAGIVGCSFYIFEHNPSTNSKWANFGFCLYCIQWAVCDGWKQPGVSEEIWGRRSVGSVMTSMRSDLARTGCLMAVNCRMWHHVAKSKFIVGRTDTLTVSFSVVWAWSVINWLGLLSVNFHSVTWNQ